MIKYKSIFIEAKLYESFKKFCKENNISIKEELDNVFEEIERRDK